MLKHFTLSQCLFGNILNKLKKKKKKGHSCLFVPTVNRMYML